VLRERLTRTGFALGAAVGAWVLADRFMPGGLPLGVAFQGLVVGALGSFSAMGLVLVYRSTRIVNFAQASIGGLAAAAALVAVTGYGLDYYEGVAIGLGVAVITGLLVEVTVIRRFASSPRLVLTVATIGLLEVLGAAEIGLPHLVSHLGLVQLFTTPFKATFSIYPLDFNANYLVALGVVAPVMGGLWWFLARTDTGTAVRAAADSPERARLLGLPVGRISRTTWVVAALLSGMGAILAAPITPPTLGAASGPEDLLPALAAAVLAGFESFPAAVGWSLVIGVLQMGVFWSYHNSSFVDVALFMMVVLALAARTWRPARSAARIANVLRGLSNGLSGGPPGGASGGRAGARSWGFDSDEGLGDYVALRAVRSVPEQLASLREVRAFKALFGAGLLAVVVLLPMWLSPSGVDLATFVAIYGLVAVSLVVLTGWAGQISLGQFAFSGVGAATVAVMLAHKRSDFLVALLAAFVVAAAISILVGLPALRLPGLQLAAVTLAFAVPVSTWLLSATQFPFLNPLVLSRPVLFERFSLSHPDAMYETCLLVMLLGLVVARNLRKSRFGRAMLAVRDNPRGAAAFGVNPLGAKLLAFGLAGGLAGLAGGLYVVALGGMGFAGIDPGASITVFAMAVVGGLGSLTGGLLGAAYVEGARYFLPSGLQLLASGAGMLLFLMVFPEGLGGVLFKLRDAALRHLAAAKGIDISPLVPEGLAGEHTVPHGIDGPDPGGGAPGEEVESARGPGEGLSAEGVSVSLGGVRIIDQVSLVAPAGSVTALVGTNGAGKSTLVRAIAGSVETDAGSVRLFGREVSALEAERRVREGLVAVLGGKGVFPSLTVGENLRMAGYVARRERRQEELAAARDSVLTTFPRLAERMDVAAGSLSGGEQQMLAIAEALLCLPKVLLIDELSLGLAPSVVAQLVEVVRGLAEQGMAVVVVEQSMNVASSVANRAVFMERGRVRFDGPSAELLGRGDLLRSVFFGARHEARGDGRRRANAVGPGRERTTRESADSPPAFAAIEISKSFGGLSALSGVSFEVAPGEIVGVIGSNGAGKTTLMDVCSGFIGPDAGRVLMAGEDVTALPPASRAARGLGRVFQDARLFPSMTVAEAVACALHGSALVKDPLLLLLWTRAAKESEEELRERAREIMNCLGLGRFAGMLVSELSTGTRRVVELACALAHDPSVLLLDEPTAGVAEQESKELASMLIELRERTGAAMVVVEHDVPLVSGIADRLVCLHLGEVVASGAPEEVLSDPVVVASWLSETEPLALRER